MINNLALQLNALASEGGAARAAVRVHQALESHGHVNGWISGFRALSGISAVPEAKIAPPDHQSRWRRHLRSRLIQTRKHGWKTENPSLHSLGWPDTGLGKELLAAYAAGEFQLLNLHWLGDSTISIEEIGRLSVPMVWTLHDQWAFSGSEHYSPLNVSERKYINSGRFVDGYTAANCPEFERGFDLNRWTWRRKSTSWCKPMPLICPSAWMASCVKRSALMADWPCHVIPNPLDPEQWFPLEPDLARTVLGLPLEDPIVLFGAMGGTQDPRKGSDLLMQALPHLAVRCADFSRPPTLVIFGQARPGEAPNVDLPVHYLGHLHDDVSLRLAYSAADVMVVPSRLDNLPNTATEAMACGTPVVAFRTGGLPEIVDHGVSGMLAEGFDPEALAQSIADVLLNPQHLRSMAARAREQAEAKWHPARIAALYAEVYSEALLSQQKS